MASIIILKRKIESLFAAGRKIQFLYSFEKRKHHIKWMLLESEQYFIAFPFQPHCMRTVMRGGKPNEKFYGN